MKKNVTIFLILVSILASSPVFAINGLDEDVYLQCAYEQGGVSRNVIILFDSDNGKNEAVLSDSTNFVTAFLAVHGVPESFDDFYIRYKNDLADSESYQTFRANILSIDVFEFLAGNLIPRYRIDRSNGNMILEGSRTPAALCIESTPQVYLDALRAIYQNIVEQGQ